MEVASVPEPRVFTPPMAPHFDLPFRFQFDGRGGSAVVREEGTIDDLGNVALLMLLVPLGYRNEAPSFGTPDLVFRQTPVMSAAIQGVLRAQDQRIEFAFSENTPGNDELVRKIQVGIAARKVQ